MENDTITNEEYMAAYEEYMRQQEQRKQLEDELDKYIRELLEDED